MSDEQDALLQAVFDAPEDDAPRLVYADWMEEHGEEVYAGFIRHQVAIARIPTRTPERDRLRKAENALWNKLKRRWSDLFEGFPTHKSMWKRGFLHGTAERQLHLPADVFVRASPRWWPRFPVRRVDLYAPDQFPPELLECDYLRRLTRLGLHKGDFAEHALAEEFAVALFRSTRLERLEWLEVFGVALSAAVSQAIATAPFLPQLRHLIIGYRARHVLHNFIFPGGPDLRRFAPEPGLAPEAVKEWLQWRANDLLFVPPGETRWSAIR